MKTPQGYWRFALVLLTILLVGLFLFAPSASSKAQSNTASTTAKATISDKDLPQVLLDIRWCESRDDQSKKGKNYDKKGVLWSEDIGVFQINDYWHEASAKKLGYDIYTQEGNTAYALVLYNANGTKDWDASKPCWSDIEAWRAKHQSYY